MFSTANRVSLQRSLNWYSEPADLSMATRVKEALARATNKDWFECGLIHINISGPSPGANLIMSG